MLRVLLPLWSYRGFILGSIKREFQSKYQNSLLGAAWTVLNPLAMITVYTLIFSQIMRARLPGVESAFGYSVYLCAGLLTWGLFAEIVGRAQNIFLEQATLIKKLSFPRLCLPFIVVGSALVNFAIIFGIFTLVLVGLGLFPGWAYVALVPLLALQVLFAVGLGITVGILNVFFRDVGQMFGVVLQFWFWLTPIVYPIAILPEQLQPVMYFNPLARLMTAYQDLLVAGQWPNWYSLWPVLALALLFCGLGLRLFRRRAGEMVDEL